MIKLRKGIALVSTGIDSPVAFYLAYQAGIELEALYLTHTPHPPMEKLNDILKQISLKIAKPVKLHIIDLMALQTSFFKHSNRSYQCIFCKRAMYRLASALALKKEYDCIVTGENLAQVASQTLQNLFVIEEASSVPVIRPLLGFDKQEIVNMAKALGTYEISIRPEPGCPFLPTSPITRAKLSVITALELSLNQDELFAEAISKRETYTINHAD